MQIERSYETLVIAKFFLFIAVCETRQSRMNFPRTEFEFFTLKMRVKFGNDLGENLPTNVSYLYA